jgi:pimeloyl-ACP methyl ester carboxylesterase
MLKNIQDADFAGTPLAEKRVVETNGIRIAYEDRGWGEPLVLIMGFAADGQAWDAHAQAYAEKFRCFLVDNRGTGHSDKPVGPYTTAMMADDYAGLIRGQGLGKVHVMGVSMGAAIAQQLALRHPDLVRSLVLICAWPRFDASSAWALTAMGRLRTRVPQHVFDAQMAACMSHDTREEVRAITAPTLLAVTAADIFTSTAGADVLHARIAGSEIMILPGSGPVSHWEDLEEFTQATMEWMEKH